MTSAFHSRSHTTPNHPGSENVTLIIRCSYGNHRDREDSWNGLDSEAVRIDGWHRQWRQNRLHNDQKGWTSTNCVRGSHMGSRTENGRSAESASRQNAKGSSGLVSGVGTSATILEWPWKHEEAGPLDTFGGFELVLEKVHESYCGTVPGNMSTTDV